MKRSEYKIGEIFEYNGEWYQCVEDTEYSRCINCCFYNGGHKLCTDKDMGNCAGEYRSDAKYICFKKLEKVGEPYMAHDHSRNKDVVVQDYKLYNQHACYNGQEEMLSFGLYGRVGMVTIKSKEPIKRLNCENSVEIQIKEDMGEKKDNYDGNMDKECIQICDVLNSISDVRTTESCCGHCKDRFMVFFTCDNPHSLAIIARVFDRRYIGTSQPWYIELQTKDSGAYDYFIHSETKYDSEEVMMKDINQIIENIKYWSSEKYKEHFINGVKSEEKKKLNLKPFNFEEAKAGKPVYTRDGRKVRIICFDAKRKNEKNIIALVPSKDYPEFEDLIAYPNNGNYYGGHENDGDIMMLSEKKEGWVNVYREESNNNERSLEQTIYKTRKDAFANACPKGYITTIKIEWEE